MAKIKKETVEIFPATPAIFEERVVLILSNEEARVLRDVFSSIAYAPTDRSDALRNIHTALDLAGFKYQHSPDLRGFIEFK